jgi:hypothetical protein
MKMMAEVWTGWSELLPKDKEGTANFQNETDSDLVVEDNEDEDEYKDVEPEEESSGDCDQWMPIRRKLGRIFSSNS